MTSPLPSETTAEQAITAAVIAMLRSWPGNSAAAYFADCIEAGDWKPHLPAGGDTKAPEPTEAEWPPSNAEIEAAWREQRLLPRATVCSMLQAAYAVRTAPAAGEAEPKSERDTATEPASATVADRSRSGPSLSSAVALAIEALGKARILAANYVDERYRYKATPVLLGITAALTALTAAKGTAVSPDVSEADVEAAFVALWRVARYHEERSGWGADIGDALITLRRALRADRSIRKPVADAERGRIKGLNPDGTWLREKPDAERGKLIARLRRIDDDECWAAADLLQADSDAREDEKALVVFVVSLNGHPQMVCASEKTAKAECDVRNVQLHGRTALDNHWEYRQFEVRNEHRPADKGEGK